jgi:hypothetical protein
MSKASIPFEEFLSEGSSSRKEESKEQPIADELEKELELPVMKKTQSDADAAFLTK